MTVEAQRAIDEESVSGNIEAVPLLTQKHGLSLHVKWGGTLQGTVDLLASNDSETLGWAPAEDADGTAITVAVTGTPGSKILDLSYARSREYAVQFTQSAGSGELRVFAFEKGDE